MSESNHEHIRVITRWEDYVIDKKYLEELLVLLDHDRGDSKRFVSFDHPTGTITRFRPCDIIGIKEMLFETMEWSKQHDKFFDKEDFS